MTADRRIIKTAAALGEAVGVSRWTIQAIRKAGKVLGDPLPNYT
jgi:DNA-binding XRE family transcriptional regulator